MRLGVLFQDGGLMTFATRLSDAEQMQEAKDVLEGANKGVRNGKPLAKIVSIDVDDTDIVELTADDLRS